VRPDSAPPFDPDLGFLFKKRTSACRPANEGWPSRRWERSVITIPAVPGCWRRFTTARRYSPAIGGAPAAGRHGVRHHRCRRRGLPAGRRHGSAGSVALAEQCLRRELSPTSHVLRQTRCEIGLTPEAGGPSPLANSEIEIGLTPESGGPSPRRNHALTCVVTDGHAARAP
jgi:hypothetical protein